MTPEQRDAIAAQSASSLIAHAHNLQINDDQHWASILGWRGWLVPDYPAGLIYLAGPGGRVEPGLNAKGGQS